MFNYIDPKEERHNRVAQIAANLCREQHFDPTTALEKVAGENALNAAEVEDVCAKLNHILFQEKFAADKLAVFNAAQYDKVTSGGIDSNTVKVASYDPTAEKRETLIKRAEEIAGIPIDNTDGGVPQQSPIMEDASHKYRSHEFNRFVEQTAANASEISAHHMAIDSIIDEMKERILALYKEGVALEEIYKTILMAVGESQAPAVQQYFSQVIEDFKREGYMPEDQQVYFEDPEKVAADFSVEERLSKLAADIKHNTDAVIIKEAAHEVALDLLCEMGRMDLADMLDKNVDGNRMTESIEKNASSKSIKELVLPSLILAAGISGLSGAAMGVSSGYRALKRNKVKKMLPNLYPELKEIPENKYSDLYDTITNLDPGLVKAPYAISEMIKRYADYGTIDTGNILQLQSAHKPGPAFTEFAVAPARDVLSSVGKEYLKKEGPQGNTPTYRTQRP